MDFSDALSVPPARCDTLRRKSFPVLEVDDRILTLPHSRIVNLVAGAFMVLGGIAHFFPIHM
jgi:hypothetical protein